ncbi:hypothetical protein [Serinicoccus sediminis]|uniref:hypothetical protein n=1 Tax=Serinicoccus sediminis TaxID=2306021 RepID=UPI001021463E|nr:hypothetical protein [Serinicoccus sediminis]
MTIPVRSSDHAPGASARGPPAGTACVAAPARLAAAAAAAAEPAGARQSRRWVDAIGAWVADRG